MGVYKVVFKKKVERKLDALPPKQAQKLSLLVDDLGANGPVRANWPNYGKLKGTNTHHCHIDKKWVACWVETQQGIQIEVTYAGSRESAPYA